MKREMWTLGLLALVAATALATSSLTAVADDDPDDSLMSDVTNISPTSVVIGSGFICTAATAVIPAGVVAYTVRVQVVCDDPLGIVTNINTVAIGKVANGSATSQSCSGSSVCSVLFGAQTPADFAYGGFTIYTGTSSSILAGGPWCPYAPVPNGIALGPFSHLNCLTNMIPAPGI